VNAQLREATSSSSEQLDKANKLAIEAQREAAKLKKELDQVKAKLEEEEKQRTKAQTRTDKKEGGLRKSIETLPGKLLRLLYSPSLDRLLYLIICIFILFRALPTCPSTAQTGFESTPCPMLFPSSWTPATKSKNYCKIPRELWRSYLP
jgi:hypothetical protein